MEVVRKNNTEGINVGSILLTPQGEFIVAKSVKYHISSITDYTEIEEVYSYQAVSTKGCIIDEVESLEGFAKEYEMMGMPVSVINNYSKKINTIYSTPSHISIGDIIVTIGIDCTTKCYMVCIDKNKYNKYKLLNLVNFEIEESEYDNELQILGEKNVVRILSGNSLKLIEN